MMVFLLETELVIDYSSGDLGVGLDESELVGAGVFFGETPSHSVK
jgi:hypothetical protein